MLMIAVDEAVIAMLDSGNHELVFAACGVLMNLMVDDEKRPKLLHHGGVSKYVGSYALCCKSASPLSYYFCILMFLCMICWP